MTVTIDGLVFGSSNYDADGDVPLGPIARANMRP
jgi:hypothetical protein